MTDYRQWKTAISTKATDYETLLRLKNCGVDAMELSVPWQECDQIDWAAFRKNADAAGIEIWSYHLPFSQKIHIASPDEERPLQMAAAKKSLAELAQFAEEHGAVMCVEDLPRTCLGHTADEMLELVSADSRLRVCFDVNHLLTVYGSTHEEFIQKLGSRIVTTHMSDYDFLDEKHFFPGCGMIDWKSLVEQLEAADYSGPFLYEGGFSPSFRAPEVPHGTYEMARERHMTIKELCGKQPS